jgi:hypothetical protein
MMPNLTEQEKQLLEALRKGKGYQKLAEAMTQSPNAIRHFFPRCERCGKPGVTDTLLHSDDECVVYLVMES